ncbi:MAG TPA: hypothetical protein VM689_09020 [Aliidongia sp.]|nr:hypothetical protein [Aliidongia sp.]
MKLFLAGRTVNALGRLVVPFAAAATYFFGLSIGDTVRFQFDRARYDQVVSDASHGKCPPDDVNHWPVAIDSVDCKAPVTIIFAWGGFGSSWYGVVYDEADEIIKPARERSIEWKHRPIGVQLSCSGTSTSLGGHYYLAGGYDVGGVDEWG